MDSKPCRDCGVDTPLGDYYRKADGRPQSYCKPCHGVRNKAYKTPEYERAIRLRREYGLTPDEANELLAAGCAICDSVERLVIDHCHASGRVRAALCTPCNLILGHAKDDPDRLRAAADYLEKF